MRAARSKTARSPRRSRSARPKRKDITSALVLVERFGLDGKPPRSLEEVSARYGISRISVRLLEGRLLRALRAGARRPTTASSRPGESPGLVAPAGFSLDHEAQP